MGKKKILQEKEIRWENERWWNELETGISETNHERRKREKKQSKLDSQDKERAYWKNVKSQSNWHELEFCPLSCKSRKGNLKKFYQYSSEANKHLFQNQKVYKCKNTYIVGYHIS